MFETDEPVGFSDVYQVKKKNNDLILIIVILITVRRGHNHPFSFEN